MSTMTNRSIKRAALVALMATLLAGCGVNWRNSTFDPRYECEAFGGEYGGDGTCYEEGVK